MLRHGGWIGVAVVAAIVGLGFALRVGAIDTFWLNGDEGIYYFIAHAPPGQAAMAVTFHAHPPAYYYLLRAVAQIGDAFVWLRVPSLVFGCLTIVAMYALAKELDGRVAGWLAALLTALSPGLIMQSQVIRPYALLVLLIAIALAAGVRFARRGGRRALAIYSVVVVLGISIHYGAVVAATGMGLWLAVRAMRRRFDARQIRDLVIAHVPIGAAMLALYVTHVRPRLIGSDMQASAVESSLRAQFVEGPVEAWRNAAALIEYLAGVPLALPAWIAFWLAAASCVADRRRAAVAVSAALVAVALALSAADLYPFGGSRHSLYLAPALLATCAVGFARLATGGAARAAVAVAVLLMLTVIGVAGDGLLGVRAERPAPFRELEIPVAEVSALLPELESVRDTPGIVIFDKVTAYTLAPILQDSRIDFTWVGEPKLRYYRWGERSVFTLDAWFANLGGSPAGIRLMRRIAKDVPNGRTLLDGDVRVVSFSGQNIPDAVVSLEPLGNVESLVSEIRRTRHFSIFRLSAPDYRRAIRRRSRVR